MSSVEGRVCFSSGCLKDPVYIFADNGKKLPVPKEGGVCCESHIYSVVDTFYTLTQCVRPTKFKQDTLKNCLN